MTRRAKANKVIQIMCFFGSGLSEKSKWLNVMNTKLYSVFFGSFSATLANFVTGKSKRFLFEPSTSIGVGISPRVSGMSLTEYVIMSSFGGTFYIAKKFLGLSFSIANLYSSNWFSTIRTWRAAFPSLFFGIFPSQFRATNTRTSICIMRKIDNKFLATYKAIAFRVSTFIAKIGIGSAMKRFPALSTSTIWIFTVRHVSLLFENMTCKKLWASLQEGNCQRLIIPLKPLLL
jgi:hypothetical protein